MQASIVSALMPITTTIPVTLIVLHKPDSDYNSVDAKKVSMPRLTPKPTIAKPTSTSPRSVTVKTKSLLKYTKNIPNHRKSLLKSVSTSEDRKSLLKLNSTSQEKKSLLKHDTTVLDKTPVKPVILPKETKSLLKPELINSEPVTAKSSQRPTFRSVADRTECTQERSSPRIIIRTRRPKKVLSIRPGPDATTIKSCPAPTLRSVTVRTNQGQSLVNPVSKHKSCVSLLKPGIGPQDKNSENMRKETSRRHQLIKISSNAMMQNSSRSLLKIGFKRPAKSLLKPDLSLNQQISSKVTLKDHDYVSNQSQILPDSRRTSLPKKVVNDIPEDFKKLQRARRNLYDLKKILEISKKKLHSRQQRMSSSIGEVSELRKLLLNLKSRNLVTKEGQVQLEAAVDRAMTVLKDNFATDPTA